MKFWKRLKFVLNVRRSFPFLIDFFLSNEVAISKKMISVLLVAGYFIFPFDLIPDFFSFFGVIDDITVLTFILQQIVKMAPESLKEKYKLKNKP
ncbi:YkvA family protein [Bacillus methanolicus]|uniref:YkvA family protein n=1 Tax=Bacillus methanolicus TaxID=1471 RepID=UPI002380B5C7|nr:DUF1232 domain-containing protein [Bacillus methanolicus]